MEAEWFSKNYTPSFKEQIGLSVKTTGLPLLLHVALMATGQLATKEAFDWALDVPDMVKAMAETGRFLNDISAYYKVLHIHILSFKKEITRHCIRFKKYLQFCIAIAFFLWEGERPSGY